MSKTHYTEDEIQWAIGELKKKHPDHATRDQAISLLDSLGELPKFMIEKMAKDKKSGKLNKN